MLAGNNSHHKFCTLAVAVALVALPASAEPPANTHDNSGRQIAQVIPGMPHPTATPGSVPFTKRWAPGLAEVNRQPARPLNVVNRRLSSLSTPVQLSPQARQALQNGFLAAQGMSRIALKRVNDMIMWLAVLFQNLDGVPRITPATTIAIPQLPITEMRPINEPGKTESRLYYTSESRVRTVVGR
ncbi:MAG TPA: hypothetical protein V6D22_11520 [Candidatus Obscuribacterales bacterium]